MGCDIHLHIEVKIADKWHHYAAPQVKRWYGLFELMAGVRGEVDNAVSPPKGFPDDITEITRLSFAGWESDIHSRSWLGVEEIEELQERITAKVKEIENDFYLGGDLEHEILHTYLFGSSFTGWKKYPEENDEGVQDVRFVFGFDN